MTIKEFNLLEIDLYDEDKLIYNGMCEDIPENLKQKEIKILKNNNKKLIVQLVK